MTTSTVPGTDHPEERGIVDLLVADRGEALISWVERVEGRELVVTAGQDRSQRRVRLEPGQRVELVWRGPTELRSLPAELVASEGGCWRLRPTGPAARGQRRAAVRAPLSLAVRATVGSTTLSGTTVDVSEGGFRAVFPGSPTGAESRRPGGDWQVGDVVDVVVELDTGQFGAKVEVIRRHQRTDDHHEVSARFVGLPERVEDRIRATVFAGLRDLRRRGLV
ncbi:hypothetical protein GCM10023328_02650 [Modestobacter marinus]|uniref:PilZ domain-containing protein n=1 Tax=Modestobacter marinus TaxID=477641 RepID=A0A846LJ48_9ACTN|nr:PilZ domain-containing protein [Modestobacter marinus]NIH67311.1 hypothetical protein [Modestobacter marinus]GGL53790.1 hypothetical protein GCM10011589_07310 [Modestobacter marinus]